MSNKATMLKCNMNIKLYLKKNNISFDSSQLRLIKQGIEEMKNSKDILHPVEHIYRIFGMYATYRKQADSEKIEPTIFLTAVVWHDVWKARLGTRNVVMTAYAQVMEGIMAARLFRNESQKFELEQSFVDQVSYAIRKHSQVQFLPLRTPEAKLLWDLDKLDKWDPARVKDIKETFFAMKNKFWRFLFKLTMMAETERGIHFEWLKEEFATRKKNYFRAIGI